MPAALVFKEWRIDAVKIAAPGNCSRDSDGSPTETLLGFASVAIVKFPIAPKNWGEIFCNGFTSSATGSLLISTSRRSPSWLNGFEKNGSENGSS